MTYSHKQEKVEYNLLPVSFIFLFPLCLTLLTILWLFIDVWKWPSPLLFWASMQDFGCIAWLYPTFCSWLNTTSVQLCNSSVFEPGIIQSSLYRMGSLSFSFPKCSCYILYDHIFRSSYKLHFYCKDIFRNIYISLIYRYWSLTFCMKHSLSIAGNRLDNLFIKQSPCVENCRYLCNFF